jgi:hypothetical protein
MSCVGSHEELRVEFTPTDRLEVAFIKERGKVTAFAIQYQAVIRGHWISVVRYDTNHGYLHRHRFWLEEDEQVDDREPRGKPSADYTVPFKTAYDDLSANWRSFRAHMTRKRP